MHRRRRLGFVLLLLGLALTARLAPAQTGSRGSHIPIPGNLQGAEAQKLIEERLRQLGLRSKDQMPDDLRKLLNNPDFQDLLQKLVNDGVQPTDPQFAEEIKKFVQQQLRNGRLKDLKAEDLQGLQEWARKVMPDGKLPDKLPFDLNLPHDTSTTPDLPRPPVPNSLPSDLPSRSPPGNPIDPETLNKAREQLERFSKRLEGVANKLDESPALQEAVRDLAKHLLDMQKLDVPYDERLDVQLAQLSQMVKDGGEWFKGSWQALKNLDLPEMPKVDLPKIDLPTPNLPDVTLPNVPLPNAPTPAADPASVWQTVLTVVAVVMLGLLLWRLVGRLPKQFALARSGWKLGPWPIHPSNIATREDLIKAFEYLSLLRLGYEARAWNHLLIAARLGNRDDCRRAAANLAALYEKARYTPESEPLPADALATARRDLCFLAGGSPV